MELLGVNLQEPVPAKVPVTFWLSAPQEAAVQIPAGTEVATVQTETEPSIVFTTDESFEVRTPNLQTVMSHRPFFDRDVTANAYRKINLRRLDDFETFSSTPQENDALYFGFAHDLSHHILELTFSCSEQGGVGVDPTLPPYLWEAAATNLEQKLIWERCELEDDRTKGLTVSGRMQIHLPHIDKQTIGGEKELYWVRLRVRQREEYREGMQPYDQSPRINDLTVVTVGGTIQATHAQAVSEEILGLSDGAAGQRYQLEVAPILPRKEGEGVLIVYEDQQEIWREVADFANCGQDDKVFTLDSNNGEIRLGPAVRQRNGEMKLYGAIPPRQATVKFTSYRHGGGQKGNVAAGTIRTLKTSIPFIGRVYNRQAAAGGLDEESLQDAMVRAPALLRSKERAVTESDFEFFAQQALRAQIGRVKCLQPRPSEAGRVAPGQVYLLVIPRVLDAQGNLRAGYIAPEELEPARQALDTLRADLDGRRLLTTRLDIRAPAYRWVAVRVQCRATPDAEEESLRAALVARLNGYLNPLTGGNDGQGWPFGRELFESDVYQCLQGLPQVQFIRKVEVYVTTPGEGVQGNPVETVEVVGHGTVASGLHEVEFV
jgi:predicted phage baseplate assembly protein